MNLAAAFIGRDNAVAVIGRSWRATQDIAARLGVRPQRVGRIALYDARELVEAIRRHDATEEADQRENDRGLADEIGAMRKRIARAG